MIVYLTKSLVKESLSLLVHIKSTVVSFFFAEKMRGAFVLLKLFIFFGKKCNLFAYNTFENLTPR